MFKLFRSGASRRSIDVTLPNPTRPLTEDRPPRQGEMESGRPESAVQSAAGREMDTAPSAADLAIDRLLDQLPGESAPQLESTAEYWPKDDQRAPDYRHLPSLPAPSRFELTPDDIELQILANRYRPEGHNDVITLAIRGAVLASGHQQIEQERIAIEEVRPDHVNFKCLLGFYFRKQRRLTLLAGSTVPCPYYMKNYYFRMNGKPHETSMSCNMLPTGCYVFRVGAHGGGSISPALRMTDPNDLDEDSDATVLRSIDNLQFTVEDKWDHCVGNDRPYDNVHCAYYVNISPKHQARFSSAGCLTVRGRADPSDQWAHFQSVLSGKIGRGKRTDVLLLTGRDYAIAAHLRTDPAGAQYPRRSLARLRVGSQGTEVGLLQRKLGFKGSEYFGPATKARLAEVQAANGLAADGVYSPDTDNRTGWGVLTEGAATAWT